MKKAVILLSSLQLTGCAGLVFNDAPQTGALTYRDPAPYLFVSLGKDCTWSAIVLSLPGTRRSVRFKSGYGSANLSVALSNGIITSAGQQTDTKIPETITALSGLAGSLAKVPGLAAPPVTTCTPAGYLYPIDTNGKPNRAEQITFPSP